MKHYLKPLTFLNEVGVLLTGVSIGILMCGQWKVGLLVLVFPTIASLQEWAARHGIGE